jgi:glutathione peroxidase
MFMRWRSICFAAAGDRDAWVKRNFTRFLVDRNGNVIARFEPKVKPDDPEVTAAIEKALK